MNNTFDKLIAELKLSDPEMWKEAQKEAKEWADKVKSGEIQLDIRDLYFDDNGLLMEVE